MEWDKQNQNHQPPPPSENGIVYVKVMTDEQLETLRKQIAIYASICEQLVQMHKTLTAHQDLAGIRVGNLYCDPLMTSKITARQRWTPTPVQLKILEGIFDQGNGTPSKQRIKELTSELSHHGQISETNVYNWFQNRRARSKRKQVVTGQNNGDSEAEAEVDSPEEKTKLEQQNPGTEGIYFHSPEISSQLHFLDPPTSKVETVFPSDPIRGLDHMTFNDDVLSSPSM